MNLIAGIFLVLGWLAIRQKNESAHAAFMGAALFSSFLFLCFYLTYHLSGAGVTRYQKEGLLRIVYFAILFSHTPLAIVVLPVSLVATYHALRKNYTLHVRITRWLLPVWIYVSVTGVVIYLMLYRL